MSKELVNAIANMEQAEALELTQKMLDTGVDVPAILALCREAMEVVGSRFEKNEYFLPELIMGGQILKKIALVVKPKMQEHSASVKRLGKVVIGTVKGDIHDIGKDIVLFMLDVNGFEVYDLGVDVPAQYFVDKIKETGAQVVGLSGFLTMTFDSMKETVEAIDAAGLRSKVKIMIGGGTVTEDIKDYTGADAFGEDAMAAVSLTTNWLGGGKCD